MNQISLSSLKRFSILPILITGILTAVFAILDIRASVAPPLLYPILQTLFIFVAYTIAVYFTAIYFRRIGTLEILLVGTTLLLFGTSAVLAAWFSRWGGLNTNTTIHNTSALLGSLLLLTAMFLFNKEITVKESRRVFVATVLFGGAIAFMTVLTVLTLKNLLPTFFNESGPTILRQVIYGTASVLLIISFIRILFFYQKLKTDFLYWSFMGFGLIVIGFVAGLFVDKLSDPLSWIARIALYFSGLYFLMAGLVISQEAKGKRSSVDELIGNFRKQSVFNYENLVGTLKAGVISIDEEGRVLTWNRSAEKMFGYSRNEAVGLVLFDLIFTKESGESVKNQITTRSQLNDFQPEAKSFELNAKKRNGEEFSVEILLSPNRLVVRQSATRQKADVTTLIIRDITARKQAEEALRESEEKFRGLFNSTSVGIQVCELVFDADSRPIDNILLDVNPAYEVHSGLSREQVIGRRIKEILGEVEQIWFDRYAEVVRTGQSMHFEDHNASLDRWFDVYASSLGGNRFIVTFTDITDRKQAEEALQKAHDELEVRVQKRTADLAQSKEELRILASQILTAQENERKRIALEVHDVLGSSLSAIKFKAEEALFNFPRGGDSASKPLESLTPLITETIEEARRIQADLRPPLLDDLGIVATLSWFSRRFETIYSGIKVERSFNIPEEEVPDHLKISLFRVTQEAMNNIGKHAKSDRVYLSLQKVDSTIELGIRDNGDGFDLEVLSSRDNSKKGLGLSSMKERVEYSGGSFFIDSVMGKGTAIKASWPV